MSLTIHIKDIAKPKVQAFLDYARTLKFLQIEDDELEISEHQEMAILEARESYKNEGGVSHMNAMDFLRLNE
jgi:hypothetical protein